MYDLCGSCRWWDQRYPENKNLGVCTQMGMLLWPVGSLQDAAIVLKHEYEGPDSKPTSDVQSVRTGDTFGCIGHTQPGTWVRTAELRRLELRQMRRTF